MRAINCWQRLEDAVWVSLQDLQSRRLAFAHRFYDTKSAGNLLPIQPADFLLIFEGRTTFIEVKFSAVHLSLTSCFSDQVKTHQLASAELVTRAGGRYLILFYSNLTPIAEWWDGMHCRNSRKESKRLLKKDRLAEFRNFEEALKWIEQ